MDSHLDNCLFLCKSTFRVSCKEVMGLEFVTPALNQEVLMSIGQWC